ncbi:hypothetical protein Tco_0818841 [Tanacetum coccineum]
MADDQPMWGNNQVIAPTLEAIIVAVDLGDNFTVKGHHLFMITGLSAQAHRRIYQSFTQQHHESLADAWLRMKDLLRSCHGHGLGRGTIIQIFYHGLDEPTQAILDAGGIFLYKPPNEAHQLLEDRVLLKLDWSKENKTKPLRKTVAFAKRDMKEMRDICNKYGGPHPSSDCDDKPMGGPKEEEANYASGGY